MVRNIHFCCMTAAGPSYTTPAALPSQPGEAYALWVNNYSSDNGFTITFTGDALLAEKPFTSSKLYLSGNGWGDVCDNL